MKNTIEVNGILYRKVEKPTNKKIIVLTNGWVFCIDIIEENHNEIIAENCKCIRRWGTSKGLGELQLGVTEKSIIDPFSGTQTFYKSNIIYKMDIKRGW
jgi:hypothetical protein